MDIIEAIALAVIIAIVSFVFLVYLGMRTWSALVLALLLCVGIMVAAFPPTELLKRKLSKSVLMYMFIIIFVAIFVLAYALIKCSLDFP